MENYYSILSISPSAETEVIKAAYRALSKIYHPDVTSSGASESRMQKINIAYETLSDETKRKIYDDELISEGSYNFASDNRQQDSLYEFENDWKLAVDYYPDIQVHLNRLNLFSYDLGSTFKIYLLDCKLFGEASSIAEKMEDKFLEAYFGVNTHIQALAKKAIIENEREIALELNQAVRVLGDDASQLILKRVKQKFPDYFKEDDNTLVYILKFILWALIVMFFLAFFVEWLG